MNEHCKRMMDELKTAEEYVRQLKIKLRIARKQRDDLYAKRHEFIMKKYRAGMKRIELAKLCGMSRSSISKIVDMMETREYHEDQAG